MMDALLIAVKKAVWSGNLGGGDSTRPGGFNYDYRTCMVMPTGQPPPGCGDVFVAVHPGPISSDMMNALNEYYGFRLTLTMRVTVPPDRIGDQLMAKELAQSTGFDARAHRLKAFLHMNWGVMQDANNVLVDLEGDVGKVYGFCEPAHFADMDLPALVGGEWFGAAPDAEDVGLRAEMRFDRCRRLQAIATYT